jgi:hypothetical protein
MSSLPHGFPPAARPLQPCGASPCWRARAGLTAGRAVPAATTIANRRGGEKPARAPPPGPGGCGEKSWEYSPLTLENCAIQVFIAPNIAGTSSFYLILCESPGFDIAVQHFCCIRKRSPVSTGHERLNEKLQAEVRPRLREEASELPDVQFRVRECLAGRAGLPVLQVDQRLARRHRRLSQRSLPAEDRRRGHPTAPQRSLPVTSSDPTGPPTRVPPTGAARAVLPFALKACPHEPCPRSLALGALP